MRFRILFVLSVCILSFSNAQSLFAQIERATLEGTITDQSGGSVAGAVVTATDADTGIASSGRTNAHGYCVFPGLAVGNYTVDVSDSGFQTRDLQDVVLVVGEKRIRSTCVSAWALFPKGWL